MTTALWILLVIALLLTALNLLRVGVDAEYDGEGLFLRLKAGPVKITILPKRETPEKPKKKKKEKPPKDDADEEKPGKKKKSPLTLPTLLKLVRPALEAAGSFRRKLSVDLLRLHARVGTSDPYNTAMTFAYLQSAVYGLQPLVERSLNVKERDVWLTPDFTSDAIAAEGRLIGTIRIGQIMGIALVLGWKALLVIIRQRRKKRKG